jgi:hypothetical protein
MASASKVGHGLSAISPENRDPMFRIALKRGSKGRDLTKARAQKGNPANRTGHTLRVALQYNQKTPKNNGLLRVWLAHFRRSDPPQLPFSGVG